MQMFLIIMLALPVKIMLRLVFRIKYVWILPGSTYDAIKRKDPVSPLIT